jgi:hypothetical protein
MQMPWQALPQASTVAQKKKLEPPANDQPIIQVMALGK